MLQELTSCTLLWLIVESGTIHSRENVVAEAGKTSEEVEEEGLPISLPTEFDEKEGKDKVERSRAKVTYSIVFVTSEAAPYSKTGGLGDVCGSLPVALASRGHRVMVVSPRYLNGTAADEKYALAFDLDRRIKVNCFGAAQDVAFFHQFRDGVDWVRVYHAIQRTTPRHLSPPSFFIYFYRPLKKLYNFASKIVFDSNFSQ